LERKFDPVKDWPLVIAHHLLSTTDEWLADVPDPIVERCKTQSGRFRFRDQTFVRVLDDGVSTVEYVPSFRRAMEIRKLHEGLAHLKFDSLADIFHQRFWWPSMDADIRDFISRCPACQMNRSNSSEHSPTPIRPLPPAALPFERWGMDFVQNLTPTKSGNRHIITAIDYATRWVVAKAVPQMTEVVVAEFLYDLTMQYGAPCEIITDRGKSFLSEGVDEYKRRLGIRHLASTPYHPQTNGMVERMHSMLGHGITTLVAGKTDRWDEFLDQTVFAIRVRRHAVTKKSPFYLLYGVHPRLPGDSHPPPSRMQPLDEIEEMEERSEIIARTLEDMGQARAAAHERSKAQAEAMRRRQNIPDESPDHHFKVGDWVKLKHHSAEKFEFRWKGPYHVVDLGFPGTYWLMTPDGLRLDSTVNQSDLAPWLAPVDDNEDYFYDGTQTRSHWPNGEGK
jgi:transposase InsO family protein